MIKEVAQFANGYRLKNLRTCSARNGIAWSATIYNGGKKIGVVRDEGNGGAVYFEVRNPSERSRLADIAKQTTKEPFEAEGAFLSALADYTEHVQRLKTRNKKAPVVVLEDERDENGVPSSYSQYTCANTAANLAAIRLRHPQQRLLEDELHLW